LLGLWIDFMFSFLPLCFLFLQLIEFTLTYSLCSQFHSVLPFAFPFSPFHVSLLCPIPMISCHWWIIHFHLTISLLKRCPFAVYWSPLPCPWQEWWQQVASTSWG
jgi:hypothetical protein